MEENCSESLHRCVTLDCYQLGRIKVGKNCNRGDIVFDVFKGLLVFRSSLEIEVSPSEFDLGSMNPGIWLRTETIAAA